MLIARRKVTELEQLPEVSAQTPSPAGAARSHAHDARGRAGRESGLVVLARRWFPRFARADESTRMMWLALASLYVLALAATVAPALVALIACAPLAASITVIAVRDWRELAPYHSERPPPCEDVTAYLEVVRMHRFPRWQEPSANTQAIELEPTLVERGGRRRL